MRKFVPLIALLAFVACKNEGDKTSTEPAKAAASVVYPYTAEYSSSFEMGNAEHSKAVLQVWKEYDNNTLTNAKSVFADKVDFFWANSVPMMGVPVDSALAEGTKFRSMYDKVESKIHAFVPLKSTDKNENWVLVWGTEYDTKGGKVDSVEYQETWRFNKDGKADRVYQYSSKMPAKK
jgi:hypothetical protein